MSTKEAQVFRYETPDLERGKASTWLCRSDLISGMVQVVKEGGETNLHAHPGDEGFWMVLSGRAKFYGEDEEVLADLGKYEGILVPRGMKYWFESSSEEPLEILRVGAKVPQVKVSRVDFTPPTASTTESRHLAASTPERAGSVAVSRPPDGWER